MSRYEAFDVEDNAIVWTDMSDVRSSNASAWWLCEGGQLFINLGDFGSGTDVGCYDQRVSTHGRDDRRMELIIHSLFTQLNHRMNFDVTGPGVDTERAATKRAAC
jgi:hypothetical protein